MLDASGVARVRPKHPAQFTPSIITAFDGLLELPAGSLLLDPFAGLGDRASEWCARRGWTFVGVELEEWAGSVQGDATALPIRSDSIDGGFSSVTYANGLADPALRWSNPKGRRTYDLALGSDLRPSNSGRCGLRGRGDRGYDAYLEIHRRAFAELYRVLKPGAPFLLNCSDVVADRSLRRVTGDNATLAVRAGFSIEGWHHVPTPRYRNGRNAEARADHEDVVVLRKPVERWTLL